MSTNEGTDIFFPAEVSLTPCPFQRQVVHGQHHHLKGNTINTILVIVAEADSCHFYLLPCQSHPLKALRSVVRTAAADELKEVVTFQVAGLLPTKLGCSTHTERWYNTSTCLAASSPSCKWLAHLQGSNCGSGRSRKTCPHRPSLRPHHPPRRWSESLHSDHVTGPQIPGLRTPRLGESLLPPRPPPDLLRLMYRWPRLQLHRAAHHCCPSHLCRKYIHTL